MWLATKMCTLKWLVSILIKLFYKYKLLILFSNILFRLLHSTCINVARYCIILHWCNIFMLAINISRTFLTYCYIALQRCDIIIKSCLFRVILFGYSRKCNIESPWAFQLTFITKILLLCRIRHHVLTSKAELVSHGIAVIAWQNVFDFFQG